MHQMLSTLWSSGCQGETDWWWLFKGIFQGFACHSWNSHAAAKRKQRLVNSNHDLWSHFTKLSPRWLSWKGCKQCKTFRAVTPQRQRGQMQGCVQQKLASAALALAAAAQTSPYGDKGDQDETQKKKKEGEKLWKLVKNSILGLKIQHLWADSQLLGQERQRSEVVSGSGLRGTWHWGSQWRPPHSGI